MHVDFDLNMVKVKRFIVDSYVETLHRSWRPAGRLFLVTSFHSKTNETVRLESQTDTTVSRPQTVHNIQEAVEALKPYTTHNLITAEMVAEAIAVLEAVLNFATEDQQVGFYCFFQFPLFI